MMVLIALADAVAAAPTVGDPVIDALLRGGPMGLMLCAGIILMRQWREWRREERAADAARDAAAAQREADRQAALHQILDRSDRQHDRTHAAVTDVSREVQTLRSDVQSIRTTQDRLLPALVASGDRRG